EISCALVGGVAALSTPKFSTHAGKAGMLSPDGTCYTFDDRANGFVPGEGVGVLVLKRLEDALSCPQTRAQDQIYGTILGSATNQDGTTSGITAPSSLSQEQLHRDVYDRFNIPADSIGMIEAHGTGTKLGDPIEFQALTRAFRKDTQANAFCALGSVKTNIGHCLTASGVAGVMKVLLAMKHQSIPASNHFQKGNAHIQWDNSPFFVNQQTQDWSVAADQKRRAAVSSFGFSGTNANIVLEEYSPQAPYPTATLTSQPSIIVLSAKTPDALREKTQQLHNWIQIQRSNEEDCLSIAYTLQTCREEMNCRMGFIASSIDQMQAQLECFSNNKQGAWKQGQVKQGKAILAALDESDFTRWIEQQAFQKLLSLWVVGANIDWQLLYGDHKPQTIRLPTYPFAKDSYWLGAVTTPIIQSTEPPNDVEAQMLHYTPIWKSQSGQELPQLTQRTRQRLVLSIGDLGLADATMLQSNNDNIANQFEDYAIELLQHLRVFSGKKEYALVQLVIQDSKPLFWALSGLLKSAALESSYLQTQLIIVDNQPDISTLLEQEAKHIQDQMVRHQGSKREVLSFVEQSLTLDPFNPWKENGVYVITGGLGKLGQIFAQEILSKTALSTVILTGRKPLCEVIRQQLQALCPDRISPRLHYEAANISDSESTQLLMKRVTAEYGNITGIIHSAGVIKDQLIANKTPQELRQVFSPKVAGVIALDEASKAMNLDFFVCFSSIAGVFGNIGQADYSCANAFVDQYMIHRQSLVEQGSRRGMSLSINWPLWCKEGGMQVDDVTRTMLQNQGLTPMPNEQGLLAFYQAFSLSFANSQNCFLYGDHEKLASLWTPLAQTPNHSLSKSSNTPALSPAAMMTYLKDVISDITKLSPTDLIEDQDFSEMGFDSIMSMNIAQRLAQDPDLGLGELPPTILFEINTIEALHGYLLEQQSTRPTLCELDVSGDEDWQQAPLSLSKAQEGLWLLHKRYPDLTSYNVPLVFEVTDVNLRHMQQAVDWLCQKHPILRMTMTEVAGRPVQKIQQQSPNVAEVSINVASKTALVSKINDSIQQPFSLNAKLLWRATCWHVNQGSQRLDLMVIVFHHLIIDGVSATLLLEQLFNAYKKRQNNEVLGAPVVDWGFFTYVEWEKKMLSSQAGLKLQNYWQIELQGKLPVTHLPYKKEPNTKGNPQSLGACITLPIQGVAQQRLKRYFEQNHVNASVFFLSAFQILLCHFASNSDPSNNEIILGVPVLHRPKKEMTNSLGLFVNQLPLRNIIDKTQDFLTLANSNQTKLRALISHSGYPFSEIVSAINASRSNAHSNNSHHPIFQTGFSYHNFIEQDWFAANQDLVESVWDEFQQEPALDFSLEVTPLPDQYRIIFKYNAAIFDEDMLKQLGQSYLTLIEDILFSSAKPICDYQLFSGEAKSKQTAAETTLVDLFESQVNKTPNHIALTFDNQVLTYEALNQKANAFADHLLEQGVTQQTLIALCVKPSLDLVIAILGILKAGAAYVPIDPNSPPERMRFILEDANPSILVLQSDSSFPVGTAQVIYLDTWLADCSLQQIFPNPNKANPKSLAYIIYTSGSTGRPKGVLVEHRNVAQLFQNTKDLFGFSDNDTWCLFHSYAFDFSVWEIWGALLNGGKLAIVDDLTRKDSAAFCQFVVDQQISILNQTPSAFFSVMDIMLQYPQQHPHRKHNLRKIIFGGEALELARLKPWFNSDYHLPELVNMYGITETTVHVTEITVTQDLVLKHAGKSIIGKPLPGYSIDLLDEQQMPVAQGQIGEIYVGGAGVSRGYYKQAELTEERFITNPFSQAQEANNKLYRSGDLARLNTDGNLEYIGRADDQVQIRGHRIELGEIHHALVSLNDITDATVLAVDKQRGKTLVAYLIASKASPVATIRADLQTLLPDYMIPSFFVFVEQFPLTANGKIDKKALSQLPLSSSSPASLKETNNAASITVKADVDLQQTLTEIWKSVLEIDHVSIDDGFFDAGGTSILANVLAAKIESQLAIDFPLTLIFQYSTIREMNQYILGLSVVHAEQATLTVETTNTKAPIQQTSDNPDYYQSSVAVIGMSCNYPESKTHHAFWQNLIQGKDLVRRLNETSGDATEQAADNITWLDSWVEGQDMFDPDFFKMSEKNVKTMSYSARQLLLHAHKAVEDAGYNFDKMTKTGVYISSSNTDTPDFNLHDKIKDGQFVLNAHDYVASTLNQPGTLPTMISYHLGFTGPSLFVHSNCSSSLSAVALACTALKAKEIDYAIVGAACFYPQRYTGYQYEKGLNFAKDARCKVFDEKADGMVGGNGVSVIVLKRADDAAGDTDHVYSVIRGVNINNDGKDKAGFFAPGTKGQMSVIQQTLQNANVNPETISYVEAHGTGTSLGDPIEFSSLQQVYQQYTDKKQFCGLGAVKSNLGHTDTLAGLTGLIKTSLSIYHKKIPATLHYSQPNSQINLQQSPFYIVDSLQDWNTDYLPRRAAVSSFGIGGTNAHAIVEEYTPKPYVSSLLQQPSLI
ncbi:MAG: amino acid adenylation domain-containing protein, partial [Algicola sp.]|nr:amino acid adenylation domain-containing protein [Algicola sp.]